MMGHREAAARDTQIQQLIAANEAATREFQARLQGINDTALTNSLRRRSDSLLAAAREARGGQQVALAQLELQRSHDLQRKFNDMDLPAVHDANDPAIVLITTELGGKAFEATGFSVNAAGLIVTNRHVVMDSGTRAARISVKFANTKNWIRAHIVKLAPSAEVDLALIQPDDAATYPAVHTIAGTVDTPVGGTIATLGFPLGTDVQMEGSGNDLVAKTSLTVGTVSKSVTDLLQIDSFAAHGSSGSPVFDAHGHVIGVVWGGPRDAAGRMVYAVPAPRIAELVRGAK
jgi:S1-C subfamily serine protease